MRFMKRIVMLLFLSVMVCTLSAQEKKGETIGERIVANAYNADSIRGIFGQDAVFHPVQGQLLRGRDNSRT